MIGRLISDSSDDDSDIDDLKHILESCWFEVESYVESEEVSDRLIPIATILTSS